MPRDSQFIYDSEAMGSNPTLVRVFLCPCVGSFTLLGLNWEFTLKKLHGSFSYHSVLHSRDCAGGGAEGPLAPPPTFLAD